MPFRQATGREKCNDCRCIPDLGAPVWRGDLTPAIWCASCAAANLGRTVDGPVPRTVPVATGLTGLREMVAKYAPQVARAWQERDE